MSPKTLSSLCAALALVFLVGCGASWKTHKPGGADFSVEMPGTPKTSTESTSTAVGEIKMNIASVERSLGKEVFMVIYNDYPESTEVDLDGAVNGCVSSMNGKILNKKSLEIEGNKAVEFRFEGKHKGTSVRGKARIIAKGNRMYQILALTQKDTLPEADVKRFLESFKIG